MRLRALGISALVIAASACAPGGAPKSDASAAPAEKPAEKHSVVTRTPDAAAGRSAFVLKGCVICHSINGVGGKAAPALDAHSDADPVDPVAFAARMWRGAAAMVELQNLELGYVIDLSPQDIVNISAFTAEREEQQKLKVDDIPKEIRDSLLDEKFWETEDWSEFLKKGQEGAGDPDDPAAPAPKKK